MTYDDYRDRANSYLLYSSGGGGRDQASFDQARATKGVGLAILALAEALRPEPMTVDLTINTEDVKTAVREGLEGGAMNEGTAYWGTCFNCSTSVVVYRHPDRGVDLPDISDWVEGFPDDCPVCGESLDWEGSDPVKDVIR